MQKAPIAGALVVVVGWDLVFYTGVGRAVGNDSFPAIHHRIDCWPVVVARAVPFACIIRCVREPSWLFWRPIMNTNRDIIRIDIDGDWTAEEMARSLAHASDLYNLRLLVQVSNEDARDWERVWMKMRHSMFPRKMMRHRMRMMPLFMSQGFFLPGTFANINIEQVMEAVNLIYPEERLRLRRIQFASPGFKDLAGFGEIVGHLKDFLLRIIELCVDRRKRNLENDERELRNQSLRINNARDFLGLSRDYGYSETETRRLVSIVDERQETFVHLVESGKMQQVRMLSDNSDSNEE